MLPTGRNFGHLTVKKEQIKMVKWTMRGNYFDISVVAIMKDV